MRYVYAILISFAVVSTAWLLLAFIMEPPIRQIKQPGFPYPKEIPKPVPDFAVHHCPHLSDLAGDLRAKRWTVFQDAEQVTDEKTLQTLISDTGYKWVEAQARFRTLQEGQNAMPEYLDCHYEKRSRLPDKPLNFYSVSKATIRFSKDLTPTIDINGTNWTNMVITDIQGNYANCQSSREDCYFKLFPFLRDNDR